MKKIYLLFGVLLVVFTSKAQDIIFKADKSEIKSIVLEITDDVVKYKKFDFQDGPTYNIKKADVFIIIYKNGNRETFTNSENKPAATATDVKPDGVKGKFFNVVDKIDSKLPNPKGETENTAIEKPKKENKVSGDPANNGESKQVLATMPYKTFQLYAGDILKFEVNGENKKMDIHYGEGHYWSEVIKVKDLNAHTINIKKDGLYTIGWIAGLFKKNSEVSLIRIPASGKEKASTVAPENTEHISVKDGSIYKGSTQIGAITYQKMGSTDLYKITNATGTYVAKFVGTLQSPNMLGSPYTKLGIYKGFDIVSTSTPLKVIENKSFDRADQTRDIAVRWLVANKYL